MKPTIAPKMKPPKPPSLVATATDDEDNRRIIAIVMAQILQSATFLRRVLSALVLLILCGQAPAQTIVLPPTFAVPQPGFVIIAPSSVDADSVVWFSLDPGLQMLPSDLLKNNNTAVGMSMLPGTYRLAAVAAKAVGTPPKAVLSPMAICTVTVGGDPGPVPSKPKPVPPTADSGGVKPSGSLYSEMQLAYDSHTDPNKAAQARTLAATCRRTAVLADEPSTQGTTQLRSAFRSADTLPVTALPGIRQIIKRNVDAVIGTKDNDGYYRPDAVRVYNDLAAALETVR